MKISKLKIGATIPTRQYENIQPSIEIEDADLDEASNTALTYIRSLVNTFSEHGTLPEISASVSKKSFNEEDIEVEFDPIRHTYFYKGKSLVSATTYIKKFYKPFSAEKVAENCAKSWKVDAKDIQDMWKSNSNVSSSFGTVIHNALEHYDTHKAMAETIEKNSKKSDVALPKHPFLQNVIKEFYALDSHFTGQVVPEALITDVENGYCGHADRVLITGTKTCRIQDYKVNVDADKEDKNEKPLAPFDTLPPSKLTKYRLQMSFYANMLQKSGWTVEGLDAFVYEDEWKHYQLEPLNLI